MGTLARSGLARQGSEGGRLTMIETRLMAIVLAIKIAFNLYAGVVSVSSQSYETDTTNRISS